MGDGVVGRWRAILPLPDRYNAWVGSGQVVVGKPWWMLHQRTPVSFTEMWCCLTVSWEHLTLNRINDMRRNNKLRKYQELILWFASCRLRTFGRKQGTEPLSILGMGDLQSQRTSFKGAG